MADTYGSVDRVDGSVTKGAYGREYVVREKFAYHLPEGLDAAAAAPLCAPGSRCGNHCVRPAWDQAAASL